MSKTREWIYGRNPIYEVLRAGKRHAFKLLVAQGAQEKGRLVEIIQLCKQRNILIQNTPRSELDKLGVVHQGVALETNSYLYCDLKEILELASKRAEPHFVLILDTLQDPQNLGTLLRTAEVVGVHGVLLPKRQTATITPAVVSASSGASEHLLVTQLNLASAMEQLKENDLWVIGLEGKPEAQTPDQTRLDGNIALVVGNEGQGMRSLVRDSCDLHLRLPMRGKVASLNAAVAGSIALYFIWQARGFQNTE